MAKSPGNPIRIVIIGAGFAGLRIARSLNNTGYEVYLIDRHNYHEFQPGGGNLVHKRLEFVVVVAIDEVDFVAGIVQGAGNSKSCETGADDDDTNPSRGNL